MDLKDLNRFALSVKEFNTVNPIKSIKDRMNDKKTTGVEHPQPLVSIVLYCFNPNHFHFLVKQEVDGGISEFFKRLSGGYTNYFNLVHKRSGTLFQGRFKSNLVDNEASLLKIRPYVHVNNLMHEIPKEKEHILLSSKKEYDEHKFIIVDKKEALELLGFYGGDENFKEECFESVKFVRNERGLSSLLDEDLLP